MAINIQIQDDTYNNKNTVRGFDDISENALLYCKISVCGFRAASK